MRAGNRTIGNSAARYTGWASMTRQLSSIWIISSITVRSLLGQLCRRCRWYSIQALTGSWSKVMIASLVITTSMTNHDLLFSIRDQVLSRIESSAPSSICKVEKLSTKFAWLPVRTAWDPSPGSTSLISTDCPQQLSMESWDWRRLTHLWVVLSQRMTTRLGTACSMKCSRISTWARSLSQHTCPSVSTSPISISGRGVLMACQALRTE